MHVNTTLPKTKRNFSTFWTLSTQVWETIDTNHCENFKNRVLALVRSRNTYMGLQGGHILLQRKPWLTWKQVSQTETPCLQKPLLQELTCWRVKKCGFTIFFLTNNFAGPKQTEEQARVSEDLPVKLLAFFTNRPGLQLMKSTTTISKKQISLKKFASRVGGAGQRWGYFH